MSLSAWLARAAERRLEQDDALAIGYEAARQLVHDHEAEHGPISQETRDWAEQLVNEATTRAQRD